MYVLQNKNNQDNYYIIKAKEKKLSCCNNDMTFGPMSLNEFRAKIKELKLPDELAHQRTF